MQVVFNLQYVLFSISNLSVCCDAVAMFFTIATSHLISSHKTRAVTELRPHSTILASCKPGCKPGFRPDLQPFSTSSCGFATRFRLFWSKTWLRTAAGLVVCAHTRQMECRKKTVLSKFAGGFRHAFDVLATRFSTRFAAG